MMSTLINRQIERVKRVSARCKSYQDVAAPLLGLSIGIGLGLAILFA